MSCGRCVRLVLAALALCAPASMACASTPAQQATAGGNIIHPLTVTKVQDMDFGYLAAPAAGTAVLDPDADSFSVTGGTMAVGGTPHCAEFVGAAQSNAVVNIRVPTQPTTLTRVGGTETMTVSKFTLQGLSRRALAKADSFTFRVGATLTVPANQVEGTYVGTFAVTVQYP
jgi:Domain of unknown function (DUF4402)